MLTLSKTISGNSENDHAPQEDVNITSRHFRSNLSNYGVDVSITVDVGVLEIVAVGVAVNWYT